MKVPTLASFIVVALVLGACDAPVVGSWQSDKKLPNGSRNKLTVESDLTGSATIYATPANDHNSWTKFKFDVEGEEANDGYRFDFNMDCKSGGCDGADFKMKCEVIDTTDEDAPDKMDCEGNKRWDDYPFDWERDE